MILVKGIRPESFADSDERYTELVNENTGHAIYQIGRVVHAIGSLDSVPLEKALIGLKYGSIIAVVEHVDCDGNLLRLDCQRFNVNGGYFSRYNRILKTFDMRTVSGVDALFDYAEAQGVHITDEGKWHAKRWELGDEAYYQINKRLGTEPEDDLTIDDIPNPTRISCEREYDVLPPSPRAKLKSILLLVVFVVGIIAVIMLLVFFLKPSTLSTWISLNDANFVGGRLT